MRINLLKITPAYLLLALLLSSSALLAQGRGGNMTPETLAERQTARMATLLELDEETKTWVHEVNLEYAQRTLDLRATHQGDREAMRSAMLALQAEKDVALAGVLTEAQMETLRENRGQGPRQSQGRRPASPNNR